MDDRFVILAMDVQKNLRANVLKQRFEEFQKQSKVNEAAVDLKWRDILVDTKMQEYYESVSLVQTSYTKQIDRCNAVIHRLLSWIDEGESQYQFALRAHKKNLETLVALSEKRLSSEENRFMTNLKEIETEYENNREKTLREFEKHHKEAKDIVNAIHHEYDNRKSHLDQEFRQDMDQVATKHQEDNSALTTHLNDQLKKLEEDANKARSEYKSMTEGKIESYKAMVMKHQTIESQLRTNETEIKRNSQSIAHWKRKIESNAKESQESNERLTQEKKTLSIQFRELKDTMAKFRATEARKLAEVSVAYEDAINHVTDQLGLAEKILKYSEMCRKLETEKEQVLPFPSSIVETDPELQRQMRQFKLQLRGDQKFVGESDQFDKFYRRYNKVLLEKLSLQRERESLLNTNRKLKQMMQKYIDGVQVSGNLQDTPNTLFIVNQNTNAMTRRVQQDKIPVLDGNIAIGESMLQLGK